MKFAKSLGKGIVATYLILLLIVMCTILFLTALGQIFAAVFNL